MLHTKLAVLPLASHVSRSSLLLCSFEGHVERLLDAAIQGMQELYDRHKQEYGWGDRPLSIE